MNTARVSFAVQRMDCARCAVELERALTRLDGVISAYVNYASERALVLYDPTRIQPRTMMQTVREARFDTPRAKRLTMTDLTNELNVPHASRMWLRSVLPPIVGLLGALALIGVYLGILSVLQSPAHAFEQLSQDRLWVGLVALGFGIQIGLYAYLRLIIAAMRLAGATALTGAGTGTSTLGMVACCAHHITDIAPLIGLTGASGLSGVVTFLGEYKIPFIILGLIVNAIGIAVSLRTIQKQRAHLQMMQASAQSSELAPACH